MERKGLPQEGLKLIACITMLIDHIGAVFFPSLILLRIIGRLSFPIYCFLLAEGAAHTKHAPRYALRLLLCALISELPYDLAFSGKLTLDPARYCVSWDGAKLTLTNREFELLRALMQNRGIVLSRERLLEQVWGYEYFGETNVVDVYIRYLRQKIDDVYGVKLIHTVRGVGYVFRDAEEV